MANVNEAVVRYVAVWNERDPEKRRALVARTWAEDGSYMDAHRSAVGHAAIDAMIGGVQDVLPGYRVQLRSGIEAHHAVVRFSWQAGGTGEAPLFLAGTDFGELAHDGRFQTVTGFTDAAPAPQS